MWSPYLIVIIGAIISGIKTMGIQPDPFQHQHGAVFTRVGTVFTGLAYGHLTLRYNISSLRHRTQQLQKLATIAQQIKKPDRLSKSDGHFLKWTKQWMNDEITETVEKVSEILQLQSNRLKRTPRRKKRQIIVAAASALGAIAGSIISEFSQDSVTSVIEQKEDVLSETVQDNLVRLNQDARDIKNLKKALKLISEDTKKFVLTTKRHTYGIAHLQLVMTVQQTCRTLQDAVDTIEAARIGEFIPTMADHQGLVTALKALRTKAMRKGFEPSIETSMDLKHLPCTTIIKDDIIYVIVHIPLYQPSLNLDLFRYVDHPVQQINPGLYATIDMDGRPTFLGITRDEAKYKEFTTGELEACYQRNKRYFCPDLALYSNKRPNCLWGLYKNHEGQIKDYCRMSVTKLVVKANRIDQDRFMITDTDDSEELTTTCGSDIPTRSNINGTKMVTIKRGCSASTSHVNINHPDYEPEVTIEGLVVNNHIDMTQWLAPDEQHYFVDAAEELIGHVGDKVDWDKVATLTAFKKRMAETSNAIAPLGSGLEGWALRTIMPIIIMITMIVGGYYAIKTLLPFCRQKWISHRNNRARGVLNRPINTNRQDEPMETDDDATDVFLRAHYNAKGTSLS